MAGMKSWSTTAANNVLANTGFTMDEGQAPSTLNDSIRQAMADIRTEWAQGANIASAATVDLSAATGGYVHITGVVTITAFGTVSAGIRRKITFDGALTLTHNAASLILPTGGNITTVAGDTCEAMSEGSGNWRVLWYSGKNVQATIVNATTSVVTPLIGTVTAADFAIQINGTQRWIVDSATQALSPASDNNANIGLTTKRIQTVFTPVIDTGTTGSGALKTNNGTAVLTWANTGAVGWGTGIANFGTITKRKTADESVTSSTVLQDDDHLTFAIAANEEWTAVFKISAGALISNTGLKMAATVPSGATLEVDGTFVGDSAGITLSARTTTSGTAFFTLTGSAGSATVDVFLWVLNGATPGNVTLQWAQQSSSGTALTLRKGSFLQATRVA